MPPEVSHQLNATLATPSEISEDFLLISEAVERLRAGIWGGTPAPEYVSKMRAKFAQSALGPQPCGPGPWVEMAREELTTAALSGKLTVYIVSARHCGDHALSLHQNGPLVEPISAVPLKLEIVKKLVGARGGLTDHPVRVSRNIVNGNDNLFVLLCAGVLIVRQSEYFRWYKAEKRKRKWPSQRFAKRHCRGRPRKYDGPLKNAIVAHVNDGNWTAKQPITELERQLKESGHIQVPSHDTLGRVLKLLWVETGHPAFEPRRKRPRGRTAQLGKSIVRPTPFEPERRD